MEIRLIQQTTLAPAALNVSDNVSGTVADVDDPVDSPDGNKMAVVNEAANLQVDYLFTAPPSLTPGAGLQQFRIFVLRHTAGGSDPSAALSLAEDGLALRVLAGALPIEDGPGEILQGVFDMDEVVVNENAALRVDGVTSGTRNIDIDAVEWVATHGAGIASNFAAGTPTLLLGSVLIPTGIPSSFAAGEPSLIPDTIVVSVEGEGIPSAFAAGEPSVLLEADTIIAIGIASNFAAGVPTVYLFRTLEVEGIASQFAAGEPAVAAGDPLVSATGIESRFMAGVPVLRRVDIPPDLQNRIKPGTWRMN